MSEGISHRASTEIGIAVSGIAGPDGGSSEKPVGTVCFGFKYFETTETFTKFFEGDRENIRILSTEFFIGTITGISYSRLIVYKAESAFEYGSN